MCMAGIAQTGVLCCTHAAGPSLGTRPRALGLAAARVQVAGMGGGLPSVCGAALIAGECVNSSIAKYDTLALHAAEELRNLC